RVATRRLNQPGTADGMASGGTAGSESELAALRQSITKGQPFGARSWVDPGVRRWSLGSTQRVRGRPRKK
ncbi:MAG: hypothetical protein CV090_11895, partial [Nitrospira sp. WS238]|nr:hypothetical protein [Nitrospira sp. WS238]